MLIGFEEITKEECKALRSRQVDSLADTIFAVDASVASLAPASIEVLELAVTQFAARVSELWAVRV